MTRLGSQNDLSSVKKAIPGSVSLWGPLPCLLTGRTLVKRKKTWAEVWGSALGLRENKGTNWDLRYLSPILKEAIGSSFVLINL